MGEGQMAETLSGAAVTVTSLHPIMIGEATVIGADVPASNGIIHVLDSVLVPEDADLSVSAGGDDDDDDDDDNDDDDDDDNKPSGKGKGGKGKGGKGKGGKGKGGSGMDSMSKGKGKGGSGMDSMSKGKGKGGGTVK